MYYPELKDAFKTLVKNLEIELRGTAGGAMRNKIINRLTDAERAVEYVAPRFEVGDGVSLAGYSDIDPYEVISVSKSGKKARIRAMKATQLTKPKIVPGGFAGHCTNNDEIEYKLESDPEGLVREISLRKIKLKQENSTGITHKEMWFPVGETAKNGPSRVLPFAKKFYDYNF